VVDRETRLARGAALMGIPESPWKGVGWQ
jgi:hypothetical protein